jgi:hypothetical protein
MPYKSILILDPRARDAAFRLLLIPPSTSPAMYENTDDDTLAERIAASGASECACINAIRAGRLLCSATYKIADWYRDGGLDDPRARAQAMASFQYLAPGFTEDQYATALGMGLLWVR